MLSVIPAPTCVEETGVRASVLEDLALKTLFVVGEMSLGELARHMSLTHGVVDDLFQRLRKEQLCQVTGMSAGLHRVSVTEQGKQRALELLTLDQYVGPAPVAFPEYVERVSLQSVRHFNIHPTDLTRAFSDLVIERDTLNRLGTAAVSGRTIFLHGPTGTGKTTIAARLADVFAAQNVWMPHAIEVDGQIIAVFDPLTHTAVTEPELDHCDRRWVLCRRPRVVVGGELTIDMLDLQFHPIRKFYVAPVQMKAANGVLIVDDFGRQRVRPEELLNRWVVPLDRSLDYLTLAGGRKLEVPFDLLLIFATNLDPSTLADEAFLRRIQIKIKIDYASRDQFREIFRNVCISRQLPYKPDLVDDLLGLLAKRDQPLRACCPRDIVDQVCWAAKYQGQEPQLTRESLYQACRNYFLFGDDLGEVDERRLAVM